MTNNWGHNKVSDKQKLQRIQYMTISSEEVSLLFCYITSLLSTHASIKEYLRLAQLS